LQQQLLIIVEILFSNLIGEVFFERGLVNRGRFIALFVAVDLVVTGIAEVEALLQVIFPVYRIFVDLQILFGLFGFLFLFLFLFLGFLDIALFGIEIFPGHQERIHLELGLQQLLELKGIDLQKLQRLYHLK